MLDLLADPQVWAGLITLTILEIVLGIDNLVFLSLIAARVEERRRELVRRLGLSVALLARLGLLFSIAWVVTLSEPIAQILGFAFSWRDIILGGGGLFLLAKGTIEIHHTLEGETGGEHGAPALAVSAAVAQIVVLDLVFSLDSVITAVGMVDQVEIMVTAIVIAIGVMLFAAKPVGDFVMRHPTVKMLALSFLLLIGMSLIGEGLHFHIPKGYIYFAIFFSLSVEALNLWAARRRRGRLAAAG